MQEKNTETLPTSNQKEMILKPINKTIRRSYLICFNPYATERDNVLDALDKAGAGKWRTEISGCIMLKSSKSADEIRQLLLAIMKGRFIVAEISGNRNGMMTQKGWDFLADSKNTEVKY